MTRSDIKKRIDAYDEISIPYFNSTPDAYKYYSEIIKSEKWSKFEDITLVILSQIAICDGDTTKAIHLINESIKMYDKVSYPHSFLGTLYGAIGKFRESYNCCKDALKKEGSHRGAYIGLGLLAYQAGHLQPALTFFKDALTEDDKYPLCYMSISSVYQKLESTAKAFEYIEKAYKIQPESAYVCKSYADLYKATAKYTEAKEKFEIARQLFTKSKNNYEVAVINDELAEIDIKIKLDEAIREKSGTDDQMSKIFSLIEAEGIDESVAQKEKKSKEFLEVHTGPLSVYKETYFEVLRRWNSYTPIVADNYHISKGGGYFIKINEAGIVIDPGFNFIDNFRAAKHKFHEITRIIISHAHNDHTSDLESILTLLYKYNMFAKETLKQEMSKNKNCTPDKILPTELDKEFKLSAYRKIIHLYITKSVFKKYAGLLNLESRNDYKIHIIEAKEKFEIPSVGEKDEMIPISIIEAKHDDIISDRDSIGFILSFAETCIVYTGDTGWSPHLANIYGELRKECANNYVVLLAHIGGFKKSEREYFIDAQNKEKSYYKNHLGRLGLAKINDTVQPDVCIISEFGEEFKGSRKRIAEIYQEAFNNKTIFLPADIGLKFCMIKKKFFVITKIEQFNTQDEDACKGYVDAQNVGIELLERDYSLHYFSKLEYQSIQLTTYFYTKKFGKVDD